MNKFKYIILALTIFVFNIHSISADCTEEEITNFKKVKAKYTATYEADVETKLYKVTLNMPLMDEYTTTFPNEWETVDLFTETSLTFSGIKPGKYELEVISTNPDCDKSFKTITVKLPGFNNFYEDPLCDGIEEFVLCSPTYSKEIDYDTFVSRVETYKKTKAKQETENAGEQTTEQEENRLSPIINYIKDNLIPIIIVIVFVVLVIITIVITAKSIRKSRRLE